MLTLDQRVDMANLVEQEGFYYFFTDYGFSDIEDEKFHRLRKDFVESGKALEQYLDLDSIDLSSTTND